MVQWHRRGLTVATPTLSGRDTNPFLSQSPHTLATAMSEEGYPASTNWEHTDSDTLASNPHHPLNQQRPSAHNHHQNPYLSLESLEITAPLTPSKSFSPPRSSGDSPTRTSNARYRDGGPSGSNSRDTPTSSAPPMNDDPIVEAGFDENVLRALCDLDCGTPLLLDRIKQSMISCRETSVFFKKRALLEEEYGRNLQKLSKATAEAYAASEGKAGSFVTSWQTAMKTHETVAENRIRFAQRLNEMSEELVTLSKEVDKNRKQTKELASRYERALGEAETIMDKSKTKVDITAEELERLLLHKEGESVRDYGVQGRSPGVGGVAGKRVIGKAVAKGGMLLKGKNPGNIQRQEDDIRQRMSNASDAFRKAMHDAQAIRQEYFNFQLPRILRSLKECADEIDLGTQYHLTRYAFLFENALLSDGSTLVPMNEDPGLKATFEAIDNRSDFKTYMQHYAYAHGGTNPRAPRREGPREEGYLPPIMPLGHGNSPHTQVVQMPVDKGRPTFGIDLGEQMIRDDVDVPPVLVKCCEAIEKHGLNVQGIYRIGGTVSKVNKLKERLDKDLDAVDLDAEEWVSEISNVTSVLKMWFRDLPDPLFTRSLYQSFIEAARHDNPRLRHIRLHERVNDLPDPNYATLKYLIGHLHKIVQHEDENAMSIQNVAIVFGPTLFGQSVVGMNGTNGMPAMIDTSLQNKAVETILEHYTDIFVDENEGE